EDFSLEESSQCRALRRETTIREESIRQQRGGDQALMDNDFRKVNNDFFLFVF
ncbi:unnamed protein product, partial [marine sediment metagenome]